MILRKSKTNNRQPGGYPAFARSPLLLVGSAAAGRCCLLRAHPARIPGVTFTELKIGSTAALSGPVSLLGTIARCQAAYFDMVNEAGGIGGRKIKFIYYDDAFNPAKTVEQVRRLIESDEVAFLFSTLGTAPNSSIAKYVNAKKIPHLFLTTNGDKWGDYESYPWSMAFAPSARTEAKIFATHALSEMPNAKFALLYANDDFGKDFVNGLRDVLGTRYSSTVQAISYENTDPTVDSQIVALRASNADVLITGATAKFGAQAIRKVSDIGWKVKHYVTSGASSVSSSITPAGPVRAKGIITSAFTKDPSDSAWAGDPAVKSTSPSWPNISRPETRRQFQRLCFHRLQRHAPCPEQCKGDFRRETIMREAKQHQGSRRAAAAARDPGQRQPDQPSPGASTPAAALGRCAMDRVRRHYPGLEYLDRRTSSYPPAGL
jgi:branched-chain amino acid transport system substrate-binding protein